LRGGDREAANSRRDKFQRAAARQSRWVRFAARMANAARPGRSPGLLCVFIAAALFAQRNRAQLGSRRAVAFTWSSCDGGSRAIEVAHENAESLSESQDNGGYRQPQATAYDAVIYTRVEAKKSRRSRSWG